MNEEAILATGQHIDGRASVGVFLWTGTECCPCGMDSLPEKGVPSM